MARGNGRPCGCDPSDDYTCESHRTAFDPSNWRMGEVAVRGPFHDVCIVIEVMGPKNGASQLRLSRFQAEDLVAEIARRLALRS